MKIIDTLRAKLNLESKEIYFYIYTGMFLITAAIVFSWFFRYGTSFIWVGQGKGDGIDQHYPTLVYYGSYLRAIFSNLIHFRFQIPLWDHNIGYGADILTTFHYYVIGNPFDLLSFFVPQKYSEILYDLLFIFRLYLAGLAFSLYAFRIKKSGFPVLIGALIYIFCGYSLVSMHTPYFINPMIYLPLLLVGVEKIFHKEKPYLFIVMLFVSLMSNFYFFYMLSLTILLYAALRVFFVFKEEKIKNAFYLLGKFSVYYFLAILMAAVIFIPNLYEFFKSARSSINHPIELLYSVQYYREFLFSFLTINSTFNFDYYYWLKMGYPVMTLAAVILMFTRKQNWQLKIAFIFLTLCALSPIFGKIFNGFSYVTNRWIFIYSFLIAFINIEMLPQLISLTKKELKILAASAVTYLGICLSMPVLRFEFYIFACLMYIAFVLVLFLINAKKDLVKTSTIYILLLVLVLANITSHAYHLYSENKIGYAKDFARVGTALTILTKPSSLSLKDVNDTSFFRTEEALYGQMVNENTSIFTHVKGTAYYFSFANPNIWKFFMEVDHFADKDFSWFGLDSRTMLGALASVKYFITPEGREAYLPYGYERKVGTYRTRDGVIHNAYENKFALPLGYTYSSYIQDSAYQRLLPLQKQQALLQGVVLKETLSTKFNILPKIITREKTIDFAGVEAVGIRLGNGRISALGSGANITMQFSGIANSETYLRLKNFLYLGENMNLVRVATPNLMRSFYITVPKVFSYTGKKDFMVNLGFSKTPQNLANIMFVLYGDFSYSNIEMFSLPMGIDYEREISALREDVLENVEILNNEVRGTIDLKSNKILVLSIPYTKGWKAYVDGKRTELLQANTMYMALPLEAGQHNIRLKYMTPGLKAGIAVSVIGWILFIGLIGYIRKQNK